MTYDYQGLATVTVMALYARHPPTEFITLELPVVLSNAGRGRVRMEFFRYLHGPEKSNALCIERPDGVILHGPITDGRNEPLGGWLEFYVEQHLGLSPPPPLNGWKWE